MSSSKERIEKALDSLLYLPHLRSLGQSEVTSLAGLGTGCEQEGGKGRIWDRGDLFRRLASFKAGTWFCKPEAIGAVECARRGWLNTGVDMLTCEFCKAKLSCPIPPQLMPEQSRATGERFAKQLADAHDAACPWRRAACAPSLLQFPPLSQEAVQRDFESRVANLQQVLCLPPMAAAGSSSQGPQEKARLEQLLVSGAQQQQPPVTDQQQQQQTAADQQQQAATGQSAMVAGHQAHAHEGQPDAASLLQGGTALAGTQAFLARARLLALCGWDVRAMSTANATPGSCGGSNSSSGSTLQPHMGPESAALCCSLCGVRAGMWGYFPKCKPQVILAPRQAAPAAGAGARRARRPANGLGGAVLMDLSTTIAGGSLKQAQEGAAAAPFGAAVAPAFGAPGAPAADHENATAPSSEPSQQALPRSSSVPVFGFAALEADRPVVPTATLGPGAAASGGVSLKRKQQDFSWETVEREIHAKEDGDKRARDGIGTSCSAPAAGGVAPGGTVPGVPKAPFAAAAAPVAKPTPAVLARYRGLESTPLDPLALHRSYCPWVHSNGAQEQQEGGRCGWRWCLQQLAPGGEDGVGPAPTAAADAEEGGDGDGDGRRWDPAALLRSMLHKVQVRK